MISQSQNFFLDVTYVTANHTLAFVFEVMHQNVPLLKSTPQLLVQNLHLHPTLKINKYSCRTQAIQLHHVQTITQLYKIQIK